jgi:hypothetical protein
MSLFGVCLSNNLMNGRNIMKQNIFQRMLDCVPA